MGDRESIKVILRCRPFSQKEKDAKFTSIVSIDKKSASVSITDPKSNDGPKTFTFDSVFDMDSKQIDVYNTTARLIVEQVLKGYNGTIFAYGQTGTGKVSLADGRHSQWKVFETFQNCEVSSPIHLNTSFLTSNQLALIHSFW